MRQGKFAMDEGMLFDSSSLIYAIKLKMVETLYGNYVQYLTVYEAINALWKEVILTKTIHVKEAMKLCEILSKILNTMKMLSPSPYEKEILDISIKHKIPAYDASYIVLAKKNNLALVTEDRTLKKEAKKYVKALSLKEVAGRFT